jgi:hypothetical protein
MTNNFEQIKLIQALLEGKILYKIHHNDSDSTEWLFQDDGYYEMRGWSTAYGNVDNRVLDVLKNPDNWNIHTHTMNDGYPYPWSIKYKSNDKQF